MQNAENAAALIGRILICLLFVLGGWGKLMAPAATQAMFAKQGLPLVEAAWVLAVVVELGGGGLILLGLFTRPVAFILAVWCVVTALIAHTNLADRAQEINFFKNMGLTGGFLYIAAFGARAWSLDAWWGRVRGTMPAV
jgi:putative oxidoreductase